MGRKSAAEVRRALLDAGEQVIARDGIEAVHSNAIARAAGVGVGTFYKHFTDKHEIARVLAMRAWEELGVRIERAEPQAGDAVSEARRLTEAIVGFAAERPDRFRLAFGRSRMQGRGPAVSISTRPLERRLRARQARGEIDDALDPAVAARAWWSMISGTLLWWLDDPARVEAGALVDSLTRLHPAVAAATSGSRAPG